MSRNQQCVPIGVKRFDNALHKSQDLIYGLFHLIRTDVVKQRGRAPPET